MFNVEKSDEGNYYCTVIKTDLHTDRQKRTRRNRHAETDMQKRTCRYRHTNKHTNRHTKIDRTKMRFTSRNLQTYKISSDLSCTSF